MSAEDGKRALNKRVWTSRAEGRARRVFFGLRRAARVSEGRGQEERGRRRTGRTGEGDDIYQKKTNKINCPSPLETKKKQNKKKRKRKCVKKDWKFVWNGKKKTIQSMRFFFGFNYD